MGIRSHAAVPTAALALGLLFAPPVSIAIDAANTVVSRISGAIFMPSAMAHPGPLTKKQSDALNTYNNAVKNVELVLRQRPPQIDAKQPMPNLPAPALS